jgi:mannan endo-1,4-beta-mannosidase
LPFIKEASGGKEPAIMGYDFNGLSPGQAGNRDAEKAIAWSKRGGIVTFQWHWNAPNGRGDFYSKEFDLKAALADPQSADYRAILRDVDRVATELKKLQAAGVPVIWRPLHEAEGKWFWWGMSGGEACRGLYRLIFDRLTKHHGLHNLIWTWTSYGKEKENWHPGDQVVDLVVWDYESPTAWAQLQELFGRSGTMFGLGEEGKLPDPRHFGQRPWLYFLTWAYMIEDTSKGNTKSWIREVYNNPRVITLADLPLLRRKLQGE